MTKLLLICAPVVCVIVGSQALGACKIIQVAELHVNRVSNRAMSDGEINGQKVNILLDTGIYRTFIEGAAARQLHLALRQYSDQRTYGVGGSVPILTAVVEQLKIDRFTVKDLRLTVLDQGKTKEPARLELLLGADFFSKFTTEFDLANGVIRLLQPDGCQVEQLAYWNKGYFVTDLEAFTLDDPRFLTNVSVNGIRMHAGLDTSSPISHISLLAAASAGVVPGKEHTISAHAISGVGGKPIESWIGTFDSIAIGNETIRNAKLRMSELSRDDTVGRTGSNIPQSVNALPDVIIGADFFLAHHLVVMPREHKILFTYNGGPVFQTRKPDETAADAPVTGRSSQ